MWVEDRLLLAFLKGLIDFASGLASRELELADFGGVRQALLEFAGTSSEEASLAHAVQEVARLLESSKAFFHELDHDRGTLTLRQCYPPLDNARDPIPLLESIVWRTVIQSGSAQRGDVYISTSNVELDEQFCQRYPGARICPRKSSKRCRFF